MDTFAIVLYITLLIGRGGWTLFGGRESPVLSVADGCTKVETRYDNWPVNFHEPNT